MVGVIFCGGQSSRMGTDKGLLKTGLKNWAQIAVAKFTFLQRPTILSVNNGQLEDYTHFFPSHQLVADDSSFQLKGPLCGLLSAHLQYPEDDLFVLACDMPFIEPAILKELYQHYRSNHRADVHVFMNNSEPEPLCGIYTVKALKHINHLYLTQQLSRYSMKFVLKQLTTAMYPINSDQEHCFRNVNTRDELSGF